MGGEQLRVRVLAILGTHALRRLDAHPMRKEEDVAIHPPSDLPLFGGKPLNMNGVNSLANNFDPATVKCA